MSDVFGVNLRHGLGDTTADVVAGDDGALEAKLLDEGDHAVGLRPGAVALLGIHPMLVRPPESAKVGHHHVDVVPQQWHDVAKVGVIPRPAVQQHHRPTTGSVAFVGQLKSVSR